MRTESQGQSRTVVPSVSDVQLNPVIRRESSTGKSECRFRRGETNPISQGHKIRSVGSWIGRIRPLERSSSGLRKRRVIREPRGGDAIERNPVVKDMLAQYPAAVIAREDVGL